MSILRKLGGIVLGLALAALALGSGGALAQKSYTLTAATSSAISPSTVTLTFTATGNSSFNSLTVTTPPGYTVPITSVSASRGTVSPVTGGFAVSGITTPVGSPSQVVTVTMTAVTTTGTCGTGLSGTWTAQPWTGSTPGSGQKFNLSGPPATTSIAPPCFAVTPSVSGIGGTISPAIPQTVAINATKQFTLSPNTGYNIGGVSGSCGGTLGGNTFTTSAVTANCTVIASFSINTYTLTYSASMGGLGGSVSPSPQTVNHGSSGSPVTATPNANYRFVNWSDGSTANPRTDSNVTGAIAVTANFALNSLTFTAPPTTVGAGAPFPVTIAIDGPGGIVSVSVSGAGCALDLSSPSTFNVTGPSATFNVTIAPTTPPPRDQTACVLSVSATGYQGASHTFANVYGGVLGCTDGTNYDSSLGKNDPYFDPDADKAYVAAPGWGLLRGQNNDGVPCVNVNATLTLNGNFASLIYDKTSPTPPQPNAAFKYVLLWLPVAVESESAGPLAGWSQKRPKVAWGNFGTAGPNWPADYVPALFCSDDGSGFENLTTTQLLALLPTIPNVAPFNTLNPATYPQYQPGQPAKMCVAQQGVTAIGGGNVQFWTKVIDQADGWIGTDDQ